MKGNFNPMKASGEPMNVSAGVHTSRKVGKAASPKMGAGSQMGPTINKGYPMNGDVSSTSAGPGKFRGANKAKMTKGSKKRKM